MNITINNNTTIIADLDAATIAILCERLSFTDKSKEYQIRRLSKSIWGKTSQHLKQLQSEVDQCLVTVLSDDSVSIPTGLVGSLHDIIGAAETHDLRSETGIKIALPWKKKPHEMREYQQESHDAMIKDYRGLLNLATGLGKTLTATYMTRSIGRKTLVVCPSKAIAQQFFDILASAFGKERIGFFGDGRSSIKDITVGIAPSVCNHIEKFKEAQLGLVIFDECFPYRQNIVTDIGPKEIGWLVKQWEEGKQLPKVKSFNEITRSFEFKTITHGWRKENPNLIRLSAGKKHIKCTPNHKLLLTSGWTEANKIQNQDKILGTYGNKAERSCVPLITEEHDFFDILVGSFLGDGGISTVRDGVYRLAITHSIKQKEYALWKAESFTDKTTIVEKNGYAQTPAIRAVSKAFSTIHPIPSKKGDCPQWIIDALNPRSLAIWMMDDGSFNNNSIRLSTCSFSLEANERLVNKLHQFGVECKVANLKMSNGKSYPHIMMSSVGTKCFIEIIKPYIHPSLAYKIGIRGDLPIPAALKPIPVIGLGVFVVDHTEKIINKVLKNRKPYVFDIEVEDNHNFIACSSVNVDDGVIAHNCHHIAANTFTAIAEGLSDTGRIYGLTATDFRNDGKDLLIEAGCGPTLIRRDAKWGIDNGFLAQPYFIVRDVPTIGYDYKDDKLKCYKAHILNNAVMKSQIEDDAQKFMSAGKRVLILVDEVAHGEELSKNLGIPFATGEDKLSQSYIDDFNAKKVMGLVGTDGKISEGVDTRPVDVLIMAHFVASKGAVLQAVGRGLRKCEGKEVVIILDYCPLGSTMLTRHCKARVKMYRELTSNVKIV